MIVVIQCAGSKQPKAGSFRAADGRPVRFVAGPDAAPADGRCYARPDDDSGHGLSWRALLSAYNDAPGANALGLCRAADLYTPPVYRALAAQLEPQRLFILSAGWGLLRSDFLTPDYDITFSAQAEAWKMRGRADRYDDYRMLPAGTAEPVLFFGGKTYLTLFAELTAAIRSPRIVFYNSAHVPDLPGCATARYQSSRRTNWHYSCAEDYLAGRLSLPEM